MAAPVCCAATRRRELEISAQSALQADRHPCVRVCTDRDTVKVGGSPSEQHTDKMV